MFLLHSDTKNVLLKMFITKFEFYKMKEVKQISRDSCNRCNVNDKTFQSVYLKPKKQATQYMTSMNDDKIALNESWPTR